MYYKPVIPLIATFIDKYNLDNEDLIESIHLRSHERSRQFLISVIYSWLFANIVFILVNRSNKNKKARREAKAENYDGG